MCIVENIETEQLEYSAITLSVSSGNYKISTQNMYKLFGFRSYIFRRKYQASQIMAQDPESHTNNQKIYTEKNIENAEKLLAKACIIPIGSWCITRYQVEQLHAICDDGSNKKTGAKYFWADIKSPNFDKNIIDILESSDDDLNQKVLTIDNTVIIDENINTNETNIKLKDLGEDLCFIHELPYGWTQNQVDIFDRKIVQKYCRRHKRTVDTICNELSGKILLFVRIQESSLSFDQISKFLQTIEKMIKRQTKVFFACVTTYTETDKAAAFERSKENMKKLDGKYYEILIQDTNDLKLKYHPDFWKRNHWNWKKIWHEILTTALSAD